IKLEKNVQKLVEDNIEEVFGYQFISTEFQLNNLRVDTLAFDPESKAFILIEYKKDRSFTVIDQGYAYLALLLNNKADFVLKYNEERNKNLRKDDIDWSQSKVVFVANSFTKYQQEAIGFQDLPIELWEAKMYESEFVSFNQIRAPEKSESINTVTKNKDFERVSREVKQYTVKDHIRENWNKTQALFEEFSERVLELDSRLEIHAVKSYISLRIGNKNMINIRPKSNKLTVEFLRSQPKDFNDPEKRVRYFKNSYKYYNQHVSLFDIEEDDQIDYALMLTKQVYKRFI
ncbi:hypothetical protein K0B04_04590, partial [Patescibacteria group bacterium]|nr:hypothetical protein [Patescibacteria group bacterium]